jgi:peroxisomal membrane protein 2
VLSINIPLTRVPRPYRTLLKGTLCFLQEVLGSHLASVPVRKPAKDAPVYSHVLARAKVDARALKMALYGFVVSAPLSHVLVGELQKAFAGRTGRAAKLGQVIASNLIVSPIQTFCKFREYSRRALHSLARSAIADAGCCCCCLAGFFAEFLRGFFLLVYLASLAVIGGAKSWDEVKKTVKAGFYPVIRVGFASVPSVVSVLLICRVAATQVMWVSSPLSLLFAQKFLSPEVCDHTHSRKVLNDESPSDAGSTFIQLWVPFFNLVSFVLGVSSSFTLQGHRCRSDAFPDRHTSIPS